MVKMLRQGTSAAAVKRLGENVLCLRLLGHDRLGAIKFSLGARIGPGNARIGPQLALLSVRLSRRGSSGRPKGSASVLAAARTRSSGSNQV